MPVQALLALLGALLMAGGLTAYGVTQHVPDNGAEAGAGSRIEAPSQNSASQNSSEGAVPQGAAGGSQAGSQPAGNPAPNSKPVPAEQAAAPTAPAPEPVPADGAAPSASQSGAPATPAPQKSAALDPGGNPAASASPTPPAAVKPSALPKPTFDVVRVEPTGDAVVAGQGAPGATVELLRNGQTFARAVADVGGQWAIVPPRLPSGAAELALRVTTPDGRTVISSQVVSVEVPVRSGDPVLVVLNSPDTPSKVLSGTAVLATAAPAGTTSAGKAPVAAGSAVPGPVPQSTAQSAASNARLNARIVTVEADQSGRFFVSGAAQPGADIRIYLNDAAVAKVQAGADGRFGLTVERGIVPGTYRVRADDVEAKTGKVLTRAEVAFTMQAPSATAAAPAAVVVAQAGSATTQSGGGTAATAAGVKPVGDDAGATTPAEPAPASSGSVAVVPELKTVTIAQGDNLWRLSRKIYGRGTRYTVIYGANTAQIRDPGLIYPGQIFVVPAAEKG